MRRDHLRHQRILADKASGFAVLLAIGSCGVALLEVVGLLVPGSQANARLNPLYWLLLLPFGWWGTELRYYSSRVTWTLVPALVLGPLVALGFTIYAAVSGGNMGYSWIMLVLSSAFGLGGMLFYHRSALRREGSAR